MKTAAAILGEATQRVPEPSGFRMGTDGAPSRFATVLMELLDQHGGGKWEMKLLQLDDAPVDEDEGVYRGVYHFASGETLAFSDCEAVIATDASNVIRLADGSFAGVWDGRDMGQLMSILMRASNRGENFQVEDQEEGALNESQLRQMEENARRWGVETSRTLSIPEQELLTEIDQSKQEFLDIISSHRKEISPPEPERDQLMFRPTNG